MNNEELKEQIEIYKNERDTYKRLAKSLIKQNNKLEDRNKEIYQGFIATVEEVCEANKKIERLNNNLKSLYNSLEIIDSIRDENVVKMQIRNLLYNYKELKGSDKDE